MVQSCPCHMLCIHTGTDIYMSLILPHTNLYVHRQRHQRASSFMYTWIAYSWTYAGSYLITVIPQDWGFSFCQMFRGLLIVGSVCVLYAVGYFARLAFGRAAGSFAQSVVLTSFISSCLVIPDLNRLLFLQITMTLGAIACLTGMYGSAQRSLRKPGALPSSTLVSETILPIADVNALIELSPILLVIVTIIGMFKSA
jgi:hypothetical protein